MPPDVNIIVSHGPDYSIQELLQYEKMVRSSLHTVQNAIKKKMSLEEIHQAKLLDEWKKYSHGFFSCDEWINIIYRSLIHQRNAAAVSTEKWLELKGPYLGQKPPGKTPEIFTPGIVSTDYHDFGITFSKDGREMFFTRREDRQTGNRILHMKEKNGRWTKPAPAPFASDYRESEPNFSPDGKKIYFNSRRPVPEGIKTLNEMNVWIVQKKGDLWGEPYLLGSPVMDIIPMMVTETLKGTIYTTGNVERGIYKADFENNRFNTPERLPEVIHTVNWAGHPYIAPDESYLIYDANIDSECSKNLFISYRLDENKWTKPVNLSTYLNLPKRSWCPFVTFDRKFFFFCIAGDIYWVDAEFIEELKDD